MAYNYARERRKFDAEWKRKASWYRKEGMSEESIAEMYRFDLAQLNRDRAYESRRRPLETACGSYTCSPDVLDWVDQVENPSLSRKLKNLPVKDKELLTLYIMQGFSQTDIAHMRGVGQPVISRQLERIFSYLKETF